MIKTNCETCCFCKKGSNMFTCLAERFCASDDNQISTPGCCRMHRTYTWLRQCGKDTSLLQLLEIASEDARLNASLIVFFDEKTCTTIDLDLTIKSLWKNLFFTEIIIADITNPGKRTGVLIKYIDSANDENIKADFTMDDTYGKPALVLRRIGRRVRSKYFFVISAGFTILGADNALCELDEHLRICDSRCVYWYFPKIYGKKTELVESQPIDGLYLTRPFQYLIDKSDKPFSKQLSELSEEQGLALSYLFDECVVVKNDR